MAETHVVSALRVQRAEISAYIHGLEKKVEILIDTVCLIAGSEHLLGDRNDEPTQQLRMLFAAMPNEANRSRMAQSVVSLLRNEMVAFGEQRK